jgi:hypothetical protein
MARHEFTSIWAYLQSRKDLDNILCEVVGRSLLQSTLTLDSLLHCLCVVKVGFDLQRLYLQPGRLSATARSLLLSPPRIVELLQFVLESSRKWKTANASTGSGHFQSLELYVCQVVISGIRALLLIKQKSPGDHPRLWDDVINRLMSFLDQFPAGDSQFNLFVNELKDDCLRGFSEDRGAETRIEQCAHQTVPYLPDIDEGLVGVLNNLESCQIYILTNGSLRLTRG